MTKNILLSGVGGQGTITAAKMLTFGLMEAGYDVKMSEIHGMSQRGGDVVSQVRYSKEKVFSSRRERQTSSYPLKRWKPSEPWIISNRMVQLSSIPRRFLP